MNSQRPIDDSALHHRHNFAEALVPRFHDNAIGKSGAVGLIDATSNRGPF